MHPLRMDMLTADGARICAAIMASAALDWLSRGGRLRVTWDTPRGIRVCEYAPTDAAKLAPLLLPPH